MSMMSLQSARGLGARPMPLLEDPADLVDTAQIPDHQHLQALGHHRFMARATSKNPSVKVEGLPRA